MKRKCPRCGSKKMEWVITGLGNGYVCKDCAYPFDGVDDSITLPIKKETKKRRKP